jgi:hypothetical protein
MKFVDNLNQAYVLADFIRLEPNLWHNPDLICPLTASMSHGTIKSVAQTFA